MSLKDKIKKIDMFGMIPDEIKEASIIGLGCSIFFLLFCVVLVMHTFNRFMTNTISSELIVDHIKDDRDLTIHLDVLMFRYPCGLVSLDKIDAVHTHIMNVKEGLEKVRISRNNDEIGAYTQASEFEERVAAIERQVNEKEGCRVKGTFKIKFVPGNFHISFHDYINEFNMVRLKGFEPDFSHRVNHLSFGEEDDNVSKKVGRDFGIDTTHAINGQEAKHMLNFGFFHSVTHHLNIVPSKFIYEETGKTIESYQYTSTMIKGSGNPSITFQMGIENVVMIFKAKTQTLTHFLIMLMAIIGGFYMIVDFLRGFVEDALFKIVFKRKIGKLE